ncbi:unnamed protein product [Callosobruchus maculatus]|uniref:Uncharacterized protein n=1 Tax=Callosobruchus maculatus TaxID=64391 RepID=A0A653DTD7_CALMS|nr:unnamed protein product [Callosobruchus maculatus]
MRPTRIVDQRTEVYKTLTYFTTAYDFIFRLLSCSLSTIITLVLL